MAAQRKVTIGWQARLLTTAFLAAGVVFLPTTILLLIGMGPTYVAVLSDRSREKNKALTVGLMNFAGCFPFWLDLIKRGHTREVSLDILTDPTSIVVMYSAAGLGYLIDWALVGLVSGVMVQRAHKRIKDITTQQEILVKRWGPEVSGEIPLDDKGFPLSREEEDKRR